MPSTLKRVERSSPSQREEQEYRLLVENLF
jgi:hypothetical protein